jgi:hypothetical protein
MTHSFNEPQDPNFETDFGDETGPALGEDITEDPDNPGVELEQTNDGDLDVDAPDDAEDTVEEGTATTPTDKPAKAKKESTRPPVPEGFISPVTFAKILTEHKRANGTLDGDKVIAPQVVYSYIKNNPADGKYPFPARTDVPGRALVLKADEGLAWWDEKDARVKAQKTAKAEKDAKKLAAAQTSTQAAAETGEVATGEVEEAE